MFYSIHQSKKVISRFLQLMDMFNETDTFLVNANQNYLYKIPTTLGYQLGIFTQNNAHYDYKRSLLTGDQFYGVIYRSSRFSIFSNK